MNTDKRWKALGESLVNYSLEMKPGEKLMIAMYETESYPLALAAYAANPLFDSKCYRFESQTSCPQIPMAIDGKRCYSGNIESKKGGGVNYGG